MPTSMKGSSELEPVQPFTGEGKQMETSMKDTSEGGAVSVGEGKQTYIIERYW